MKSDYRLGQAPLVGIEQEGAARSLVILLTHHPLTSDWISTRARSVPALNNASDVHLCGHVHGASSEQRRRGFGGGLVTVVSGAAHGEEGEIGHGYSFGALEVGAGARWVRVRPRIFHQGKQEFDRHSDILPRGSESAEHRMGDKAQRLAVAHRLLGIGLPSPDELRTLIAEVEKSGRLRPFAEALLGETVGAPKKLAFLGETPELSAGAYYDFLEPLIDDAAPGSEIWALSTMMTIEWTDHPFEREFLFANLDAAERGVRIQRIFVVPESNVLTFRENPAVAAQIAKRNLSTLYVVRERLAISDRRLLGQIGPGIIAFDDELVLVDRHSEEGGGVWGWKNTPRGGMSMATDISGAKAARGAT